MANEARLIDANAMMGEVYDSDEKHGNDVWHTVDIEYLVMAQPTVDAVEVVHGRWESRTDLFGFVRCSACKDCNIYDKWADGKKWNYCPHCGAKMDGDGNG